MKQTDRFLLAIVAGVVLLVGVALALALTRAPQGYMPEGAPGAAAHNYLLAIKQRDDARAYSYLSPELAGYPPTLDDFSADLDRHRWEFNTETATFSVGEGRITGDRAVVAVTETRFYQGGLFSSNQYSTTFDLTLRQQGGAWKIVSAQSYWSPCWSEARPCEL